jgi:hypothetical protein
MKDCEHAMFRESEVTWIPCIRCIGEYHTKELQKIKDELKLVNARLNTVEVK